MIKCGAKVLHGSPPFVGGILRAVRAGSKRVRTIASPERRLDCHRCASLSVRLQVLLVQ